MREISDEKSRVYFICESCGFKYEEREWAEKCQDWCSEHKSCSLEITRHAVKED